MTDYKKINYTSISDFLSDVRKTPNNSEAITREIEAGFVSHSFSDTLDMFERGTWSSGVNATLNAISEIKHDISESEGREYLANVTGDFLDVGTFLTGTPECWYSEQSVLSDKPHLDFYINIGALGSIKENQIINRGACIIEAINELRKNHALSIVFYSFFVFGGDNYQITIELDTVNGYSLNDVVFICSNPAFFRRLIWGIRTVAFRIREAGAAASKNKSDVPSNAIHFPKCEDGDYQTIEQSAEMLQKILEEHSKTKME